MRKRIWLAAAAAFAMSFGAAGPHPAAAQHESAALVREGRVVSVPEGSPVANYGFDVTPARLVTGLITERGVLKADRASLAAAFPERIARAAE